MELRDAAGWAGIVVALGSAVVSGFALVQSRRSAAAAEAALQGGRYPTFDAEIEAVGNPDRPDWHRLMVKLTGPQDLDEVTVHILTDHLVFPDSQYGIDLDGTDASRVATRQRAAHCRRSWRPPDSDEAGRARDMEGQV